MNRWQMPDWLVCHIRLRLQLLFDPERVGFIIPGLQIKTLKMTEIEAFSPDLRPCLLCSDTTACFFPFLFPGCVWLSDLSSPVSS